MKFAVINDTHFGARSNNIQINEYIFSFWENVFFPYLRQNNIKHIVHLGDLVDHRKFINHFILSQVNSRFIDVLKREGITMDVLVGNHDVPYKNTNSVNAVQELFGMHEFIKVYSEPTEVNIDGCDILFLPWINDENYNTTLDMVSKTKCPIAMGHLEIVGFEMERGIVSTEGIDRDIFKRFQRVYSGHYHHRSADGRIFYLGNQYQLTWHDHGDKRGFHVFDTSDRTMSFVPNPIDLFYQIDYDDSSMNIEDIPKMNLSQFKNKIVKVLVNKRENSFIYDTFVNNLSNSDLMGLLIVENSLEESTNVSVEFTEAETTLDTINKYVDMSPTELDKNVLKDKFSRLYYEAIEGSAE